MSVRFFGARSVRIGGSTYIPSENLNTLQLHLQMICNKAVKIENAHEQSIFLLAHLSYLQAFVDVNKRTARLAANIPLIKGNLVPLSFNDMSREHYMDAMIALYELNEIQPLIDLYVYSYLRTCALYDATVEAIGFNPIRVQYRQFRREVIRHLVVNQFSKKKVDAYIASSVDHAVKAEDKANVLQDLRDDLMQLGLHNIAGLGITRDELTKWKNNFK